VQLRVGSSLRVPVMYVVMVILFSRGEKHAVISVSLSEWLGGPRIILSVNDE
jgi:hypothetical protein